MVEQQDDGVFDFGERLRFVYFVGVDFGLTGFSHQFLCRMGQGSDKIHGEGFGVEILIYGFYGFPGEIPDLDAVFGGFIVFLSPPAEVI